MSLDSTKRTAGVIVAAKKKIRKDQAHSLLKIGSISAIKRIVLTFQVAGIEPIVIITGYDADVIERELSNYGVIFLHKEDYEKSQLFHLAKLGFEYLQNKCDQIMFTPVDIPLFSPETLQKMIKINDGATCPSYGNRGGHPLLIEERLLPKILEYDGDEGMPGAIKAMGIQRKWVEVEDEGIVNDIDTLEQKSSLIHKHNQNIFHPYIQISLEKESLFFDRKTKLLLTLIQEKNSVKGACKYMALSYSKAWKILNTLEEALQYPVITRKQGGSHGGRTLLTPEGKRLLENYELYEKRIRSFAEEEFKRIFIEDIPKKLS